MEQEIDDRNLDSAVPAVRGLAAFKLRDSFDERIGDRLVRMLIDEQHPIAFSIILMAAIPKWIVKLEHALAPRPTWPLGPINTARLVRAVRGLRLPSYEQHLPAFFESDDWVMKLAAVEYCREKYIRTDGAKGVCDRFLAEHGTLSTDFAALNDALQWGAGRRFLARVKTISHDLTRLQSRQE